MKRIKFHFSILLAVLFVLTGCKGRQTANMNNPTESLLPTKGTSVEQNIVKDQIDTNKYIIQTPFYQIYEDGLQEYKYRIGSSNHALTEDVKTGTAPQIEDKGSGIIKLHLSFGTNAFSVKYYDVYNKAASEEFNPYSIYADYVDTAKKEFFIAYFKPGDSPKLYIKGFFDSSEFSNQLDLNFSVATCDKLIFLNESEIYIEYTDADLTQMKQVVNFRKPAEKESTALSDTHLLDVLNNKIPFINEKGKSVYLKEYKPIYKYPEDAAYYEKDTILIPRDYSFVDLDHDGQNELIISESPDADTYLILHKANNDIYGYSLYIRWFQSLKKDGTFLSSGGAVSHNYNTISFHKNSYTITSFAIFDFIADTENPTSNRYGFEPDSKKSVFEIDGQAVSLEGIEKFAEDWSKRPDAVWIEFASN